MNEPEMREKVIKGLECCKGECLEPSNGKCPYFPETQGDRCFHALLNDAYALLKAQEPRAIKNSAGNGICPGCGHIIPAWSSPNYCGYCGQAVKWE